MFNWLKLIIDVWVYPGKFWVFLFVSILDHASQLTWVLTLAFEYSLKRLSMSICQEPTVPYAFIVNVMSFTYLYLITTVTTSSYPV
jgi:hypothetical protein